MRARPVSPEGVVAEVVDRVDRLGTERAVRVALDGAPAAGPGRLADALVDPLRERSRPVLRVPATGFLRPASLRFERGREDPDAYYEDWLDAGALAREVLDPLDSLDPGGHGRVLPSLREGATDRATRAGYVDLAPGTVVLVDGSLLLGRWLAFDLTVHLALTSAALARRTPARDAWTLPAYERYTQEVAPEQVADVVIRWDDPRRPALVDRA